MANQKLSGLREELGFLPDQDLYEFAEAVVERIIKEFADDGRPLSLNQYAIVSSYFNEDR